LRARARPGRRRGDAGERLTRRWVGEAGGPGERGRPGGAALRAPGAAARLNFVSNLLAGTGTAAAVTSGPKPPARGHLDNGVTVIFRQHTAADVAAVQLWVRAGARDEAPEEAGLSHFIEHLLFKGTPTRAPGEIDQAISALGGEMNAATSHDFTYYHVVLPARHIDGALYQLVA